MKSPTRFDANIDTIGVGRDLVAARIPMQADPPIPVEQPGDGLVVPQGVWHRVDILSPSKIMFSTPGPGGEYRPL